MKLAIRTVMNNAGKTLRIITWGRDENERSTRAEIFAKWLTFGDDTYIVWRAYNDTTFTD